MNSNMACNTKKPWSVDEDYKLNELVSVHGINNWTMLAELLTNITGNERSGKQCRERWHNHVNPAVRKGEWSGEEDALILALQRQLGNQWAKIAKHLEGRSDNAVKNRFHAIIRARSSQIPVQLNNEQVFFGAAPLAVTAATSSSFVPVATAQPVPMYAQPYTKIQIKQEKPQHHQQQHHMQQPQMQQQQQGFFNTLAEAPQSMFQLFAASAWTSSGSLKPINEVMATMSGSSQHGNVNFDEYTTKQSESPAPSIMSLSPVTVDEEFLDYWGLSSEDKGEDMCMEEGGGDGMMMKMEHDELVANYDAHGFDFSF